ncbi:MAG: 5-(carboxyamino)imidazole ribonucleotide synthase [Stellaceae bacterium]
MIAPGGIIGILGGGQLGRMTALAAAALGYRCHIYCPEPASPAMQVTPLATVAGYHDRAALERFADAVDVVTFEFENLPAATVATLAARKPVHPGATVLATCQDRLIEKDFVRALGIATTAYRRVAGIRDLSAAIAEIGPHAILKTARWGYDGKGQAAIGPGDDAVAAWDAISNAAAILEARVDFAMEISVVIARGADGALAAYPAVENRHRNHILDTTIAPAPIAPAIAAEAQRIARAVAEGLDLVGVVGVEMFVTKAGALLVNELAPRPHNSGHWTIDACVTSQFEQLVRAVCDLPLGSTAAHSAAVMKNLIGEEIAGWRAAIAEPAAKLHLYGKAETRPGRKMGHVTRLLPRQDDKG